MPARSYRLVVPIRRRVMDTENSHGGGPVSQSTLTSEKKTCGAHSTSDRSGSGMPCQAFAAYLPTLLAPAGPFAEELKIAFRLLHSVSRMEVILKVRAANHRIQLLSGSVDVRWKRRCRGPLNERPAAQPTPAPIPAPLPAPSAFTGKSSGFRAFLTIPRLIEKLPEWCRRSCRWLFPGSQRLRGGHRFSQSRQGLRSTRYHRAVRQPSCSTVDDFPAASSVRRRTRRSTRPVVVRLRAVLISTGMLRAPCDTIRSARQDRGAARRLRRPAVCAPSAVRHRQ